MTDSTYEATIEVLYDSYSENMAAQGNGFCNFGLWEGNPATWPEASARLVENVVSYFPDFEGTVLDVAGSGGTVEKLAELFGENNVTMINLSGQTIDAARELVPGAMFHQVSATNTHFSDNCFDKLMCIEAVYHFDDSARFFSEAFRVLKPGGSLVVADYLCSEFCESSVIPKANCVAPDAYRNLLVNAGFVVERFDVLDKEGLRRRCLNSVKRIMTADAEKLRSVGETHHADQVEDIIAEMERNFAGYVTFRARKPL